MGTQDATLGDDGPVTDSVTDSALLEAAWQDGGSGLSQTSPENAFTLFKIWHAANGSGRKLETRRGDAERVEGWLRARKAIAAAGMPDPARCSVVSAPAEWNGFGMTVTWAVQTVCLDIPGCDPGSGNQIMVEPCHGSDGDSARMEWRWQVAEEFRVVHSRRAYGFERAVRDACMKAGLIRDERLDDLHKRDMLMAALDERDDELARTLYEELTSDMGREPVGAVSVSDGPQTSPERA